MKCCFILLAALGCILAENCGAGDGSDKRILVIANKSWEVTPLLDVLLESRACPPHFPRPIFLNHPLYPTNGQAPVPRAEFAFTNKPGTKDFTVAVVEVWCIEDWMSRSVSSSSTKEKMRVLPEIFRWYHRPPPDLVIAFGTAAFPNSSGHNGSVIIGSTVFVHDPFQGDTQSSQYWHDTRTEQVIVAPAGSAGYFDHDTLESVRASIETDFLSPPLNPARPPVVIASATYTAVSGINITNYDDYSWEDPAALRAFADKTEGDLAKPPVGALETTVALIRLEADSECPKCPFIFIAPITDEVGQFNVEVVPRTYTQNFVCAHNGGVVLAWLLPQFASILN